MKLLCSSYVHQRSIINTTFTVPMWLCTPPWEQCTCSSCAFRGSALSSSPPQAWLSINGNERKDDLDLLFTMTSLTVPYTKTEKLEMSGNQMKGLHGHRGWHFSSLMVPAAEAKLKVMQHVSSDRLPVRLHVREMLR